MFEVSSECEDKECQKQIGALPIASRRDVINQRDGTNVWWSRSSKKTSVDSIFALTLPLAAFRLLCSPALTNAGRSKELPRLLPGTHSRADVRETTPPAGDEALLARQEGDVRHPISSWGLQNELRQSREVVGMTRSSVTTMFVDRNDDVAEAGHGDGLLVEGEAEHSMKSIEGRPETIDKGCC